MTATALAIEALDIERLGQPSETSGRCVCCGAPYEKGDIVSPFKPSSSFMDARALHHQHGVAPFICGACAPFFQKKTMLKVQKALITREAAWPIVRGENRAWFILHPPEPPFAIIFSDAKLQHLLWRTPLTLDVDHWNIQMGARTLTMRRQVVLAAGRACQAIADAYLAAEKKQIRSPFLSLDPKLDDLNTGRLNPRLLKFALEKGFSQEIKLLQSLTAGDLWGLSCLVFKGGIAELPAPLDLNAAPAPSDEETD
jgi:CRISPR type IV-associated protein Csf1